MGFLHLRELSPGPECPKWGHCHQIQVSPRAVTAPLRGRDTQIQVLVPTLKGHGGVGPRVAHWTTWTPPGQCTQVAGGGRRPGPRSPCRPRVGSRGLRASAGGKGGPGCGHAEHVPGLAGLPAPRTKSAPAGLAARHWAPGVGARRAGPAPAPDPGPTSGSASRAPRAHSPLWLTQVGFRSFIVRPPPPGSGESRVPQRARAMGPPPPRPPAPRALRPPPAPRAQRRRAIASPRPAPPPQSPPALGRRRRRHRRIPCAAPPPAAPGQRRKSRRAPAKAPRRETAPRADGASGPPRGQGQGRVGPLRVRPGRGHQRGEGRLGPRRANGGLELQPGLAEPGGVTVL